MNPDINTGGPAFPDPHINGDGKGMTLRDYFAAKALSSVIANGSTFESIAINAYRIADAMIAERAK